MNGGEPGAHSRSVAFYTAPSMKRKFLIVLMALPAAAQNPGDAAGAAFCAGCGTLFVMVPLAVIALNIAMLVWVARDARSRGLDPGMWIVLVLLTSFIGLIIYLSARPQGNLVACRHCGNRRLEVGAFCPACRNP